MHRQVNVITGLFVYLMRDLHIFCVGGSSVGRLGFEIMIISQNKIALYDYIPQYKSALLAISTQPTLTTSRIDSSTKPTLT